MQRREAAAVRLQVECLDERIAPTAVLGGTGGIVGVVQPPSGATPPAEVSSQAEGSQSEVLTFIAI